MIRLALAALLLQSIRLKCRFGSHLLTFGAQPRQFLQVIDDTMESWTPRGRNTYYSFHRGDTGQHYRIEVVDLVKLK